MSRWDAVETSTKRRQKGMVAPVKHCLKSVYLPLRHRLGTFKHRCRIAKLPLRRTLAAIASSLEDR